LELTIFLEQRFERTPDGAVWTEVGYSHPFWERYLAVFDHVHVVARALPVAAAAPGRQRVDGPGVSVVPVRHYQGPREYLRASAQVRRQVRDATRRPTAMILRTGVLTGLAAPLLARTGHPYAMEVAGDPWDVFAPGVVEHPARPFFRWWFTRQLQRQCRQAAQCLYVTGATLQRRYPCGGPTVGISNVELHGATVPHPRAESASAPASPRLVFVGALEQMYKAPDVLLDAVALLAGRGMDVRLCMVGDGRYLRDLREQAERLGIAGRVEFAGSLPAGEAVRARLDEADLFVLPSRTEGMPRALIEAMARGLPAIGSTAGGIPEVLAPEDMVPPGDAAALADAMERVLASPSRMAEMSARNLARAAEFSHDVLQARRTDFYRHLVETTEEWLRRRGERRS
jgi:glycosyltransferase involved in cell wall biosynthesis